MEKRKAAKLLQIGKYYSPYKGGMETVIQILTENVAKELPVEVLCSNVKPAQLIQYVNNVKVRRIPRFGVLFSQPLNFSYFFEYFRILFRYKVIHMHSPNPLAEIVCILLPFKQILVTHHSDLVNQKKLKYFYNPIYKLLLRRAKYIIVPTKNHITHSKVISPFYKKCKIIPFAIEEKKFRITSEVQKNIDVMKAKKPFILFVGRLVEYKGLRYLIEAMKKTNVDLHVIGQGPLKEEVEQQIKSLKLEDRVFLHGHIDEMDKFIAYYHASQLLVLPSITPNENFGMVQLEAMVCSKPIITTNLKSGVPAVAEDGISSIVVEPCNSDKLAEAINNILANPKKLALMGKAARTRFDDKYTIDKMTKDHLEIYNELLK